MADNENDALQAVRAELDSVDEELVRLVNQRAELARRIGQTKAARGLRVYAPDRERQVLDRITKLNPGPTSDRALRAIYRELMSASLALAWPAQATVRVRPRGGIADRDHATARRLQRAPRAGTISSSAPGRVVRGPLPPLAIQHTRAGILPASRTASPR